MATELRLGSPYFANLLQSTLSTHLMTPDVLKGLVNLLLAPSQYAIFDVCCKPLARWWWSERRRSRDLPGVSPVMKALGGTGTHTLTQSLQHTLLVAPVESPMTKKWEGS